MYLMSNEWDGGGLNSFIPTLGMTCSHVGNKLFPSWEQIVRLTLFNATNNNPKGLLLIFATKIHKKTK